MIKSNNLKGVWKGKTKQNYTYPSKNKPKYTSNPIVKTDPYWDGVGEQDLLNNKVIYYSKEEGIKEEVKRKKFIEKKYKQNHLGIWIEKDKGVK